MFETIFRVNGNNNLVLCGVRLVERDISTGNRQRVSILVRVIGIDRIDRIDRVIRIFLSGTI